MHIYTYLYIYLYILSSPPLLATTLSVPLLPPLRALAPLISPPSPTLGRGGMGGGLLEVMMKPRSQSTCHSPSTVATSTDK